MDRPEAIHASFASNGAISDLLSQRRVQQLRGFEDQRIDVDLTRLQRLFAGKGEQMLGQAGASIRGFFDHVRDSRQLGLIGDRVR